MNKNLILSPFFAGRANQTFRRGMCGFVLLLSLMLNSKANAQVDVTTFHYGNARIGWNAQENLLTPERLRAGGFGRRWHTMLDGMVPGSPLVLSGVTVAGKKRDLVYACTDHNSVYALDAASGEIVWSRKEIVKPLSDAEFNGNWYGNGQHGILSTPVIDRATGTLYTCVVRAKGLRQVYQAVALDAATGATRPGWLQILKGSYQGTPFVAGQVMQRGALSLASGWLYIPFGGRGDTPPWRGWVMAVNLKDPTDQRAYCSSPVTDGAGIWSGGGVAADTSGAIYAVTGNGDYDGNTGGGNMAQSVIRLTNVPGKNVLDVVNKPADFYTPANFKFLDEQDEDLGGATTNLLPDEPGATPHLIFTGGKDGVAYLLNRDNLGGIGGEIQRMRLFCPEKATYHEGIRSTSAYFDAGAKGHFVYVAGDQDGPDGEKGVVALRLTPEAATGKMQMRRDWTLTKTINMPSSPVVSSNGSEQGIVWVVETGDDVSALHAYDALTGTELYNSGDGGEANRLQMGRRFSSPIVANGRVFIGANGVYAYGLTDAVATAKGEQK